MLHEPAQSQGVDHAASYKMRLGATMFLCYAAFYAGFVAINVCSPTTMEMVVLFGMNLACVYGFGLIIVALLLALFYNYLCAVKEKAVVSQAAPAPSGEDK